jgi:hypothetical protein
MPQSYTFSAAEYALEVVAEEQEEVMLKFLPGSTVHVPSTLGRASGLPALAPIGGSDSESGSEEGD